MTGEQLLLVCPRALNCKNNALLQTLRRKGHRNVKFCFRLRSHTAIHDSHNNKEVRSGHESCVCVTVVTTTFGLPEEHLTRLTYLQEHVENV